MEISNNSSVIFRGETFDSNRLMDLSKLLEHNLSLCDMKKDDIVGIALTRSYWSIVTMVTLYRLNIPYMIINCSMPQNRIDYMLDIVRVKCIIADNDTKAMFGSYDIININELEDGCGVVEPLGSEIMYLAFTSGSTGNPKAIAIGREAFDNFADAFLKSGALEELTSGVCTTDFGFDIIYCETFLPLMAGMKIYLADEEEVKNVRKRIALIKESKVDYMQCTPSAVLLMKMNDKEMSFLDGIKKLILGGEALPESLLIALGSKKDLHVLNYYGPTETTVWATYSDLTGKTSVDIGKALSNYSIVILDDDANPVPDGQIGEICIGGKSLAIGYYHNPEATEKAFILYNGERVYRTGDLGHIENGTVYCHNRKDFQVKISGHRIELGEIDSRIMQIDGVKRAAATTLPSESGTKIICFYIAEEGIDDKFIRDTIAKFLPDYMIPSVFVKREDFIYTANGKTDCKNMVREYTESLDKSDEEKRSKDSGLMTAFKEIMKQNDFLVGDDVSEETTLESLNISSLVYVNMVVSFEDMFEFEFEDEYLNISVFNTVGDLLNYVEKRKTK